MERRIDRNQKLPAFKLDIAELEILWERLVDLFDNSEKVHCALEIRLPSETLTFEDLEDLKKYSALTGSVNNFSLWMSQNGNRVYIKSSSTFNRNPEVSTRGDTDAWCAGAIETVRLFLQTKKLWYRWFVAAPIGLILIFIANLPGLAILIGRDKHEKLPFTTVAVWLLILLTLTALYAFRTKLLPSAIIVISNKENFFKRHTAELSLLLSLIAVLAALYPIFKPS